MNDTGSLLLLRFGFYASQPHFGLTICISTAISRRIGTERQVLRAASFGECASAVFVSCRLAVSDARLALPNFDNITIRIANVAARLAVLVLWLCDKLGSSASP